MDCYYGSSLALHKHIMYEHNGLLQQILTGTTQAHHVRAQWIATTDPHWHYTITSSGSSALSQVAEQWDDPLRPGLGRQLSLRWWLSSGAILCARDWGQLSLRWLSSGTILCARDWGANSLSGG
jgi:hypothetical protein